MTQIKVLILFSSSNLGGAERSLSRMAFASEGIEYQLASLQGDGPWAAWVRSQGHEPLLLGCNAWRSGIPFCALWRLVRYLRSRETNIIYACGARVSFFVRLLGFFFPNVRLIHGVRWNPNSSSKLDIFFCIMERITNRLVDSWITNSEVAKQTLISRCKIPKERIFVIYNGVYGIPTDILPQTERPLEVLTVANLTPRKGHREYLRVCQEVLKVIPDAKFVFVGRDDMGGEVQRLIEKAGLSDHVRCEGFQADVSTWIRRARVFVLPSLWNEGCPTAILEAMSFAVPCIAFAIDGIPELVIDGDSGLLLQSGDYSGMVLAIIRMLTDDEGASSLGMHGRERVRFHFGIDNTTALHSSAFQKVMLRSPR